MRSMTLMMPLVLCVALAAIGQSSPVSTADRAPVSTIENTGVATVDVPPDDVAFWVHMDAVAAEVTFLDAMRAVLSFGAAVRKELADREPGPYDLAMSAPAIVEMADAHAVRVSARLQFSMTRFSNRETGPELFATLCDDMVAMARHLECDLEGPVLTVRSPEAVEQAAVALATENALPTAASVAELMNAHIISVDHVAVGECVWNDDPEARATLPDIRRLTCRARVKVRYVFSASPP